MTDELKHTIRIGEFKLFGLASHIVITGHDETGAQIWELNGLAADSEGRAKRIGMPWDSSDTIRGFLTYHPVMGDKVVNQTTIVIGTPQEIESYKSRAIKVMDDVNARDLDYRVDTQNSNSFAGTVLKAFGIEPQQLLNSSKHKFVKPVPGFTSDLLGNAGGPNLPEKDTPGSGHDTHSVPRPDQSSSALPLPPKETERSRAQLQSPVDHPPAGGSGNRLSPAEGAQKRSARISADGSAIRLHQGEGHGGVRPGSVPAGNPFDLKRPKLKQQSELLETDPALARRLIVQAGRDPKLFRL